jgi:hypothetical protein
MLQAIRDRLADLVEVLSDLDSRLAGPRADSLPGMVVARLAVAVDRAANDLAGYVEQLAAPGQPDRQKAGKAAPDAADAG